MVCEEEDELRSRFVGLSDGVVLPWEVRGRFLDFWAVGSYCLNCIIPEQGRWKAWRAERTLGLDLI